MHSSIPIQGLLAVLAAIAGSAAQAQPGATGSTAPVLTYRSVFEGYQPFTDEKTTDWKAANDTVGEIGGWRAYAKEAQAEPGQPPLPQGQGPAPAGAQGKPAAAGAANPHAGHGKQ